MMPLKRKSLLNIRSLSLFISAVIIFILLFNLSADASADKKTEVTSITYSSDSSGAGRVIVALSQVQAGDVEFTSKRLSNPARLCIDIKQAVLHEAARNLKIANGILKAIRTGQFNPDTVRIVIDLEGADKFDRLKVSKLASPERLVIDVSGASPTYKIVIDAGHGGHDPGAVGPKRLKEKDITLAVALRLKKILNKDPQYKVFLTRDKDIFLELHERTGIANKKSADLFISIHANAHRKKQAKGIETYLFDWTDDKEALRVAARENTILSRKAKQSPTDLGVILASLQLQNKRDESLKLAHYIQGSLVSGINRQYDDVTNLGVKQALFYVLWGAKMPSVLVEVSFITNPEEAKLLRKDHYRQQLAEAIASGIEKFLNPGEVQNIAATK